MDIATVNERFQSRDSGKEVGDSGQKSLIGDSRQKVDGGGVREDFGEDFGELSSDSPLNT